MSSAEPIPKTQAERVAAYRAATWRGDWPRAREIAEAEPPADATAADRESWQARVNGLLPRPIPGEQLELFPSATC